MMLTPGAANPKSQTLRPLSRGRIEHSCLVFITLNPLYDPYKANWQIVFFFKIILGPQYLPQ